MAIPLDMKMYQYSLTAMEIMFAGEDPQSVPTELIRSIMLEKDYDNDHFPVVMIDGSFNSELYYKIIENKDTVRFRIRMQKFIKSNTDAEFKIKKDVINDVFCVFLDENTPFLQSKSLEATEKVTGKEKSPTVVAGNVQQFFLFKESDVINANKILNNVISSGNMTDVITYCLSAAGFRKVLMSKLENNNTYSEVVIPAFTLLGILRYLSSQYGFYNKGELVFIDLDRMYIIDKNSKCTAWSEGEYKKTVFNVKYSTSADSLSPGAYDNAEEETFFMNILPDNIKMSSPSVIADQTVGSNLIIVDSLSGATTVANVDVSRRGSGAFKVLINKYSNQFKNNEEIAIRKESSNLVQVVLGDFDIDALTPNKEFVFTYEDSAINKKMGGSHRISNTMITFIRKDTAFTVSGTALFKKV